MKVGYRRPLESYNREKEFPPGISWQSGRDIRRDEGIVVFKFRMGYDKNHNPLNPTRGIRISDYTDNFTNERELAWLVYDRACEGTAVFSDGSPLMFDMETHFYVFDKKDREPTTLECLIGCDLADLKIDFQTEAKFVWGREGMYSNFRYDFLLPKYNILIEVDGAQHEHAVKYFGGEKTLERQKETDKIKERLAIENGYLFLRISESQSFDFKQILTEFLKSNNMEL